MTQSHIPFSKTEYDRRLAKTRSAMSKASIDVLFVADPSNMAWLTGYDGWSFYVPQGVIVEMSGPPKWWGRLMDSYGARRTVWMEEHHIYGYGDDFVQSTTKHPMQNLASRLSDLGYATSRIGVEMDNYYYSAKAHAVLCDSFSAAQIVDATALVNWQRSVKSAEELVFMRNAARITEKMVGLAVEKAAPGIRKNDLVADISHAAITGVDGAWGDYPAIVPLAPSGRDATAPHLTWNDTEMKSGEITFFELAGCYRRYHVPLSRSVFLGKPPQEMADAAEALTEGLEAGLKAAVVGNRACDIANALNQALARSGIERDGRCGYGVGLSYPPDWGERTISLRSNDETILQAGMTFHFMPGLWLDDWGLETTETILIRDAGPAETLCNIDRKLFVKD